MRKLQEAVWIPKSLVNAVAKRCNLPQQQVRELLTVAMEEVTKQAGQSENGLVFRHLGTFYVKTVKGRTWALHGKTGKTSDVRQLAFRASKAMDLAASQ